MILNIPYIWKRVVAHYKLRQYRIDNLTSINALLCTFITKSKVCIIYKDTPLSEKWKNVHVNVIHIDNLLTSIVRIYKFKLTFFYLSYKP